ncbi:MAG: acyl-CoA thioesterase [Gammaproteobacteria bacterium]
MSASITHEIPFHDVDSLNIVWHGHYYKYFELARTALYRSVNCDIDDMGKMGHAFPVIESHCRYSEALKYGQKILIAADFSEWEYYILIRYTISCPEDQRRLAYGHTKQAVCTLAGELLKQVPESIKHVIQG